MLPWCTTQNCTRYVTPRHYKVELPTCCFDLCHHLAINERPARVSPFRAHTVANSRVEEGLGFRVYGANLLGKTCSDENTFRATIKFVARSMEHTSRHVGGCQNYGPFWVPVIIQHSTYHFDNYPGLNKE